VQVSTAQHSRVRPFRRKRCVEKLDAFLYTEPDGTRHIVINGEPLMGLAEVGDALGVRVQNLQRVPGLPEPADRVRASRIWLGSEITPFANQRRERKVGHGR
jgi:hypothetical protein